MESVNKGSLYSVISSYNSEGALISTNGAAGLEVGYPRASDNGFYKLEYSFPKSKTSNEGYRIYDISMIDIEGKDTSGNFIHQTFILDIYYKMSWNSDNSYDVDYSISEVVTLDVHATDYRTTSTDEKYKYDNVASIYFSIPQKYREWYDYLYSVTVEMKKRLTNPIFVSNLFPEGAEESSIGGFSSPEEYSAWINSILEDCFITTDNINYSEDSSFSNAWYGINSEYYYKTPSDFNISKEYVSILYDYVFPEEIKYFAIALCDPDAKIFTDIFIDGDELQSYVKNYKGSEDLFVSSEYIPFSTKTIEQAWDSLDYSSSAGFWDYWADFGPGAALKYLFLKNKGDALTEWFEELGIEPDGYNFKDEPYLIKVDDGVMSDLDELEPEEFCDKYAIGYNDYEDFKTYCNENSNVVLYRVDVDYYISMPVNIYENDDIVNGDNYVSSYPSSAAGLVETYVYDEVKVVDITMCREGSYKSLKTSSNYVNIYPDVEGIEPEDGLPTDGEVLYGVGTFIGNAIKDFLESLKPDDKPDWVKTLITVITVIVVAIAIYFLIKAIILIADLVHALSRKKNE